MERTKEGGLGARSVDSCPCVRVLIIYSSECQQMEGTFGYLPKWLSWCRRDLPKVRSPHSIRLFAQLPRSYMEMTALSLFFFNLLPFWHLDGMQLLNVLLCFGVATGPVAYIDSENQRGGDSERMRRSIRLSRTVSGVIGLLMCLNLLLQIYHVL